MSLKTKELSKIFSTISLREASLVPVNDRSDYFKKEFKKVFSDISFRKYLECLLSERLELLEMSKLLDEQLEKEHNAILPGDFITLEDKNNLLSINDEGVADFDITKNVLSVIFGPLVMPEDFTPGMKTPSKFHIANSKSQVETIVPQTIAENHVVYVSIMCFILLFKDRRFRSLNISLDKLINIPGAIGKFRHYIHHHEISRTCKHLSSSTFFEFNRKKKRAVKSESPHTKSYLSMTRKLQVLLTTLDHTDRGVMKPDILRDLMNDALNVSYYTADEYNEKFYDDNDQLIEGLTLKQTFQKRYSESLSHFLIVSSHKHESRLS